MRYQLRREQQLYCDIDTAWNFFSSPMNLSEITPTAMQFTVHTDCVGQQIYEGMLIDYTVRPLWGIAMKWRTRISQVDSGRSFTDYQEKGPFAYWSHEHVFVPNEAGVLMYDTVDYELPLGWLGLIAHRLVVRNKLEQIFDYRYQVLKKRFGGAVSSGQLPVAGSGLPVAGGR